MAKYIALNNGTLSNPYRFIEKGKIIDDSELPEGFASKWLIPVEEYQKIARSDVPMANLERRRSQGKPYKAVDALKAGLMNDPYSQRIAEIRKNEALQDAAQKQKLEPQVVPQIPTPAPTEINTGGEAAQSSGDQEVLG